MVEVGGAAPRAQGGREREGRSGGLERVVEHVLGRGSLGRDGASARRRAKRTRLNETGDVRTGGLTARGPSSGEENRDSKPYAMSAAGGVYIPYGAVLPGFEPEILSDRPDTSTTPAASCLTLGESGRANFTPNRSTR
jgi:hypothetical protein